ncbi:hypothetical protein DFH06DRAFT_1128210 [Mycena polygramma]|nr:hypothetical protein DFH06DRAFT_1128210 [Mycena polygramma]
MVLVRCSAGDDRNQIEAGHSAGLMHAGLGLGWAISHGDEDSEWERDMRRVSMNDKGRKILRVHVRDLRLKAPDFCEGEWQSWMVARGSFFFKLAVEVFFSPAWPPSRHQYPTLAAVGSELAELAHFAQIPVANKGGPCHHIAMAAPRRERRVMFWLNISCPLWMLLPARGTACQKNVRYLVFRPSSNARSQTSPGAAALRTAIKNSNQVLLLTSVSARRPRSRGATCRPANFVSANHPHGTRLRPQSSKSRFGTSASGPACRRHLMQPTVVAGASRQLGYFNSSSGVPASGDPIHSEACRSATLLNGSGISGFEFKCSLRLKHLQAFPSTSDSTTKKSC